MDNKAFEERISQAEREVLAARQRVEAEIPAMSRVVSDYVVTWTKYVMEKVLRDAPDRIQELGDDKLSQLKREYQLLVGELPKQVDERLSGLPWPHRADLTSDQVTNLTGAYDLADKTKHLLDAAVKELVGQVGGLLYSHGLAALDARSEWEKGDGGRIRYRSGFLGGISGADQYMRIMSRYQKPYGDYVRASKEVVDARRALQQALVQDRWNKV